MNHPNTPINIKATNIENFIYSNKLLAKIRSDRVESKPECVDYI